MIMQESLNINNPFFFPKYKYMKKVYNAVNFRCWL